MFTIGNAVDFICNHEILTLYGGDALVMDSMAVLHGVKGIRQDDNDNDHDHDDDGGGGGDSGGSRCSCSRSRSFVALGGITAGSLIVASSFNEYDTNTEFSTTWRRGWTEFEDYSNKMTMMMMMTTMTMNMNRDENHHHHDCKDGCTDFSDTGTPTQPHRHMAHRMTFGSATMNPKRPKSGFASVWNSTKGTLVQVATRQKCTERESNPNSFVLGSPPD
jgi:hypothetical protein